MSYVSHSMDLGADKQHSHHYHYYYYCSSNVNLFQEFRLKRRKMSLSNALTGVQLRKMKSNSPVNIRTSINDKNNTTG